VRAVPSEGMGLTFSSGYADQTGKEGGGGRKGGTASASKALLHEYHASHPIDDSVQRALP